MSEPHEIRGPYEAYVVATKRKDGRCPGLEKAVSRDRTEYRLPTATIFHREADAITLREDMNGDMPYRSDGKYPYAVFKVHVSFVEEIK
jgi:hypothetical protein